MQHRILVVEDQAAMQMILKSAIGHLAVIDMAESIADAHRELLKNNYTLVVTNDYLPDGCGLSFFSALKKQKQFQDLHFLFLIGERGIAQKENFPVEDYLLKPIEISDFATQIVIRLKKKSEAPLIIEHFCLDIVDQKVSFTDEKGEIQTLSLPLKEFLLLKYFLMNHGKTVTRDSLAKLIWEPSDNVSSHTLDTHISSLRKKIANSGKKIRSIVKKGYLFS